MAAPGRHSGRVEGQVILNHDTYILDDDLRAFATQQVEITAIEYLPGRYRRDRFDRRRYHLVERGEARPVTSAHELGTTLMHQTTQLDGGLIEGVGSGIFVLLPPTCVRLRRSFFECARRTLRTGGDSRRCCSVSTPEVPSQGRRGGVAHANVAWIVTGDGSSHPCMPAGRDVVVQARCCGRGCRRR